MPIWDLGACKMKTLAARLLYQAPLISFYILLILWKFCFVFKMNKHSKNSVVLARSGTCSIHKVQDSFSFLFNLCFAAFFPYLRFFDV